MVRSGTMLAARTPPIEPAATVSERWWTTSLSRQPKTARNRVPNAPIGFRVVSVAHQLDDFWGATGLLAASEVAIYQIVNSSGIVPNNSINAVVKTGGDSDREVAGWTLA